MVDRQQLVCCGLELRFWDAAKEYLKDAIALNRGEFDLEDIHKLILEKKMQLWGIHDGELKAVMVTEVIEYPRQKRVRVVLIGGSEMDTWLEVAVEAMDRFKELNGADGIEILGRKGWVKTLAQHGYKEYETVIIKQ